MNSKKPYTFDEWMSEKNDEEIDLLTFSDVWDAAIESARRVCERDFRQYPSLSDLNKVKALMKK